MMSSQGTVFCGYLFKRNPTGSWQRRYCIAYRNKLVYYKHKSRVEKSSPQGTVSFIDCTCTLPEQGNIFCHKRDYCFLLLSSNREFYWSAESRSEYESWVTVLKICIQEVVTANLKIGPHSLKKVHFSKPTPCAKCENMITGMGKQGFMCKVCLVCSHKKCVQRLGDFCLRQKGTVPPPQPQPHSPHSSPSPSPGITPRSMLISSARERQYSQLNLGQLRQAMSDLDHEEQKAIESVHQKFDEPLNELLREIMLRYQSEINSVEEKAERTKREVQAEIALRESMLQSSNRTIHAV